MGRSIANQKLILEKGGAQAGPVFANCAMIDIDVHIEAEQAVQTMCGAE